jgi:hypothetical protein
MMFAKSKQCITEAATGMRRLRGGSADLEGDLDVATAGRRQVGAGPIGIA